MLTYMDWIVPHFLLPAVVDLDPCEDIRRPQHLLPLLIMDSRIRARAMLPSPPPLLLLRPATTCSILPIGMSPQVLEGEILLHTRLRFLATTPAFLQHHT